MAELQVGIRGGLEVDLEVNLEGLLEGFPWPKDCLGAVGSNGSNAM